MVAALAFLLATLAQADAGGTQPKPITPLGTIITAEDYPPLAMARNQQGKVRFKLYIDVAGKPDGCEVLISSGFAILDAATCDIFQSRAQFAPALDVRGRPVRGDYSAGITWTIPKAEPEERVSMRATFTSTIAPDGRVLGCETSGGGIAKEMGGCDLFGRGALLTKMIGRPLLGLSKVQFRLSVLLNGDVPELNPKGSILTAIVHVDFDIAADGKGQNCRAAAIALAWATPDPCDILSMDDTRWKPLPGSAPQPASIDMDILSWPR